MPNFAGIICLLFFLAFFLLLLLVIPTTFTKKRAQKNSTMSSRPKDKTEKGVKHLSFPKYYGFFITDSPFGMNRGLFHS